MLPVTSDILSSVGYAVKELGNRALSRAGRWLGQDRLARVVRTEQKWVARYRQSRLRKLPGENGSRSESDREIPVANHGSGGIRWQHSWIPGAQFFDEVPDSPDQQWIHDDHRKQIRWDGYMVVRNVIPPCLVANAVRDIAAFVGADLADRTTWYRNPPQLDGIVPMHHAQSLWDIRQSPNLYRVFAEFFGTPLLMVDMNRCIFRPPVHPRFPKISLGTIHWDTDPKGPLPASLQGVVLLSDVRPDEGGFQCLPDVFRNLDTWLKRYARREDFDFFNPGLNLWDCTQVEGKAGDVILWSTKLPHGSAINRSNRPRIAAFVSMQPWNDDAEMRDSMNSWWLTKRAPDYWRGLAGQLDPEPGPPAVLSDLGLKLIGAAPW